MKLTSAAALSGGDGRKPSQERAKLHQNEVAVDPQALHHDCGPSHDATNPDDIINAQPNLEAALGSELPSSALQARHPASENLSLIQKNTSQMMRDTDSAIKSLESQQSDAKPSFICELIDPQTGLPCGKVYTRQAVMRRHQRSALHRAEKGSFACTMCSKSYVFLPRLKNHMRDKHGYEPDSNKAEDEEEDNETPKNQSSKFSAKTMVCTLPIPETGKPCNRIFSLLRGTHNFDQHQKSAVHNLLLSKTFKCTDCRSWFSSPSSLSNHMRVAHGVRAFRTAEFSDEESDSSDDELPAPSTSMASQTEAVNTSSDQGSLASSEDDDRMPQDSGMLFRATRHGRSNLHTHRGTLHQQQIEYKGSTSGLDFNCRPGN